MILEEELVRGNLNTEIKIEITVSIYLWRTVFLYISGIDAVVKKDSRFFFLTQN